MNDCLKESNTNMKVKDVYNEYRKWYLENGISSEGKITFLDYFRKRKIIAETATINGKTERNVLKGYSIKRVPLIEFNIEGI